jgi:hypothetical protein
MRRTAAIALLALAAVMPARHGVATCAVVPNLKKALEGLAAEATKQ